VNLYAIVVSSETELDLAEARDAYRSVSVSLEARFRSAVDAAIASIRQNPFLYPVVHKSLRRVLLRKFPYFILYAVFNDTVVVFGCIHTHRDPKDWQSRV
jgi:toxin ParE1/3/4